MKGRRLTAVLGVLALFAVLSVGVAWADPPPDNPNVDVLTNAVCADGRKFDTVVVSGSGSAAHIPDSTSVGVAKSLYFDPGGANILIFERGAQGNPPTVWCEWDSPDGHFGGDILITPAGG